MEPVKMEIKMLQSASDYRSLPKNDSDSETDGIDNLDDLL